MAGADVPAATKRVARSYQSVKGLGRRPALGVALQVRQHLAIRVDNLVNEIRPRDRFLQFARRAGGAGDQQLEIELIRIHHQANHGLLIVRIPADVGEDRKSGTLRRAEHRDGHADGDDEIAEEMHGQKIHNTRIGPPHTAANRAATS